MLNEFNPYKYVVEKELEWLEEEALIAEREWNKGLSTGLENSEYYLIRDNLRFTRKAISRIKDWLKEAKEIVEG